MVMDCLRIDIQQVGGYLSLEYSKEKDLSYQYIDVIEVMGMDEIIQYVKGEIRCNVEV